VHSDDEIREQLVRESARRGQSHTAASVLTDLRPAMRRVRQRRIAMGTAAVTIGLGGIVGAAQVIRTDRTPQIRTASETAVSGTLLLDTEPIAPVGDGTTQPDIDTPPAVDSGTQPGDTVDDGASTTASTTTVFGPITTTPPRDESGDQDPDSTGSQGGVQRTDAPPVAPTPAPTTTATTVTAAPKPAPTTTSPPTTTQPTPKPERFDSKCGYVLANRSASSVEIVKVVPDSGYDVHIEDPDHGDVNVQFHGGAGEDCEVKITTTG
jgi:cell division septation protein DedD